uniref:Protein kinase domain-containing protein n=1 Tax=Tetranychus urticae TaxID=32264 RepID=T1K1Z5_TETUR
MGNNKETVINVGEYFYQSSDLIGHGAFAVVYKGKHRTKDFPVAIKTIAKKNLQKATLKQLNMFTLSWNIVTVLIWLNIFINRVPFVFKANKLSYTSQVNSYRKKYQVNLQLPVIILIMTTNESLIMTQVSLNSLLHYSESSDYFYD